MYTKQQKIPRDLNLNLHTGEVQHQEKHNGLGGKVPGAGEPYTLLFLNIGSKYLNIGSKYRNV